MAIDIIVEDGTNVPNANSYITVGEARLYAISRGVTLPAEDDAIAVMLIQANDYLEAQSCKYQGSRTYADQSLAWPRDCVFINGALLLNTVIPKNLKSAQSVLVMAVNDGLVLQPNTGAGDYVTEETVGPITTKYADPTKVGIDTVFNGADALLAPLYGECGAVKVGLRTMRV